MHKPIEGRATGVIPRHSFTRHDAAATLRRSGARWVNTPQSDGTLAGYRMSLKAEDLEYRLRADGATPVCDRILTQSDGSQLVQTLAVADMTALCRFVEADCYAPTLKEDLERFLDLCTPHVVAARDAGLLTIEDSEVAQQVLCELAESDGLGEVVDRARAIVRYTGAENFMFVLATREASITHLQYVVGCDSRLVQTYVGRRWHAVDPFAIYASRGTQALLGGDLQLRSRGQLDLRATADTMGFASAIAIPCRLSSNLYGYLMVGSSTPAFLGEPRLRQNRALLRVLALEMFDWVRKHAHGGVTLNDDERLLLQYVDEGLESREVAALLGTTEGMVNKRYCRINSKLRVKHKVFALQAAIDLGLLHPAFSVAA